MTTHRQHTVWLHYLEAWRDGKRKVHYSRNGEILPPTNPINVVVERDFYKLAPITRVDADLLEHLIIQPTESAELRKCHRDLVTNLAYISSANKIIQSDDRTSPAEKRDAQARFLALAVNYEHRQWWSSSPGTVPAEKVQDGPNSPVGKIYPFPY